MQTGQPPLLTWALALLTLRSDEQANTAAATPFAALGARLSEEAEHLLHQLIGRHRYREYGIPGTILHLCIDQYNIEDLGNVTEDPYCV
ncbi:hypothetical protein NDU88_004304 [Pleurodeles waltl]|uniref:Uncharacterized protein n=1 Tax=Pleurodeles waltl TaxID=8319 RepID=A0AAV7WU82_PLEWA|nr:hypothetical protein NDU88_004304 [Pleurodeles waltl]